MEVVLDHYRVLGLDFNPKLSKEEIVTAYRRKCKILHPDKRPDYAAATAHQDFVRLQQSYDVLRDDAKRKYFDHMMAAKMRKQSSTTSFCGIKRSRFKSDAETQNFQEKSAKKSRSASFSKVSSATASQDYRKFSTVRTSFNIDEIRRTLLASYKAKDALRRKSSGVRVSCGGKKDYFKVNVTTFPTEGVWVELTSKTQKKL